MKNYIPYPRMNILWLVDHLGFDGVMHGASRYYFNTIPDFDNNKFKVLLCVLRKEDHITNRFREKNIDVRHLGRGKFDLRTLTDILKLVKEENIQLIHTHGYGSANFGRLVKLVKKIPVIVHSHDDDRNYPFHQKMADLLLARFTDQAIVISETVRESGLKKRNFRDDKILLLHNGIPLKAFSATDENRIRKERERLGIGSGSRVIGTVTRLREEKGVGGFIQSAAKVSEVFPDSVFLIAGDGPLRNELGDLSRKLGLENKVIFAGFCEDIPSILAMIDIFVLSSLTEGLPISILEAMAMGKPIIATNVGGVGEILEDGRNGILVPSNNPEILADKIVYLMKNLQDASRIGSRAKEDSKKHDNNAHVRRLENTYQALMNAAI